MIVELDITSPDTVDSLRRELAATKAELRARDLECVRLRHGLIRTLDVIHGHDYESGSWVCDDTIMSDEEYAELRKLVQP